MNFFYRRYNRQIQQQIKELRQQREDKLVERVSLSENEKEKYNHQRVPHGPLGYIATATNPSVDNIHSNRSESLSNNNNVYRYFSKSAKKDSELFNYKKLFENIISDHRQDFYYGQPNAQPMKKSNSEGKLCQHTQAECTRCHKKLNVLCNECNTPHDESKLFGSRNKTMETSQSSHIVQNQSQNEYNEHDLPISKNQQVVIYRPSDQHMPYSFNNFEKDSHFDKDMLEDLKKYSERKLANYTKNYGSLRKKKTLSKGMAVGLVTTRSKETIPKDKLSSLNVMIIYSLIITAIDLIFINFQ